MYCFTVADITGNGLPSVLRGIRVFVNSDGSVSAKMGITSPVFASVSNKIVLSEVSLLNPGIRFTERQDVVDKIGIGVRKDHALNEPIVFLDSKNTHTSFKTCIVAFSGFGTFNFERDDINLYSDHIKSSLSGETHVSLFRMKENSLLSIASGNQTTYLSYPGGKYLNCRTQIGRNVIDPADAVYSNPNDFNINM